MKYNDAKLNEIVAIARGVLNDAELDEFCRVIDEDGLDEGFSEQAVVQMMFQTVLEHGLLLSIEQFVAHNFNFKPCGNTGCCSA